MTNLIVAVAHKALQSQPIYDGYQFCVGGVRYRNKLVSSLNVSRETNLLDLGCGTGTISNLVSNDVKYFGIDQSLNYLEKAINTRPSGYFSHSDVCDKKWVEELKISGSTIALALGLFHHLSDAQIQQLLNNLRSVLQPGGTIFSVDPTITSKSSRVAKWFAQNDRGQYVRSPEILESLLETNGFTAKIALKSGEFRMPLDTVEIKAIMN
jgi:cyclopropane fatty-acyl-phospholipid synthase-like methyltransferase